MNFMKLWFTIFLMSTIWLLSTALAHAGFATPPENPAEQQASPPTGTPTPPDSLIPEPEGLPPWFPKLLGMEANVVFQYVPPFHSPYQGEDSFATNHGKGEDTTQYYGVYLGAQLASTLQAYLDVACFEGNGLSGGVGLGGYPNGDVVRAGSSNLPKEPYIARLFLRYYVPLSTETEKVERGVDQLAGEQPVGRWEIKVGKMAATDDFDQNRYANNNHTSFMNYDFLYNTAWDYAADTRGFTYGVVTALVEPSWRLALGVYAEPDTANGAEYNYDMRELGYNLELTIKPNALGTVVRFLAFANTGRNGNYNQAIAEGIANGVTPSLLTVEKDGGRKYGFGFNFEQPLADNGETGIFGRLGWNDGHDESWSYVESDRHASLGAQLSGVHWGRDEDHLGIAYGVNGLSSEHAHYLKDGGIGILNGDGALNYGYEQAIELYYRIKVNKYVTLSPDFQFIQNPGYNMDRGPAEVYGMRMNVFF